MGWMGSDLQLTWGIDAKAGEKIMLTWIILAVVWVFLFLVWHAHAIFEEDD